MFRACFFSCGVFVLLCGGMLGLVDRVVMTDYAAERLRSQLLATSAADRPDGPVRTVPFLSGKTFDPPEWVAAGLLSFGGVTLLYALVLPGRRRYDHQKFRYADYDDRYVNRDYRERRARRYEDRRYEHRRYVDQPYDDLSQYDGDDEIDDEPFPRRPRRIKWRIWDRR